MFLAVSLSLWILKNKNSHFSHPHCHFPFNHHDKASPQSPLSCFKWNSSYLPCWRYASFRQYLRKAEVRWSGCSTRLLVCDFSPKRRNGHVCLFDPLCNAVISSQPPPPLPPRPLGLLRVARTGFADDLDQYLFKLSVHWGIHTQQISIQPLPPLFSLVLSLSLRVGVLFMRFPSPYPSQVLEVRAWRAASMVDHWLLYGIDQKYILTSNS